MERAAASEAPLLLLGEPGSGRTTSRVPSTGQPGAPRTPGRARSGDRPRDPVRERALRLSPWSLHRGRACPAGRVELAAGGTLVFDHVEEIPLASQPKLLRLLAERRYRPLGGEERTAEVRFIALAPRTSAAVRQGVFRDDLYYRLEVLSFRLPPLRERLGELPQLVRVLVQELAGRFAPRRGARAARSRVDVALPVAGQPARATQPAREGDGLDTAEGPLEPEARWPAGDRPRPLREVEAGRSDARSPTPVDTRGEPRSSSASAARHCGRSGGAMASRERTGAPRRRPGPSGAA